MKSNLIAASLRKPIHQLLKDAFNVDYKVTSTATYIPILHTVVTVRRSVQFASESLMYYALVLLIKVSIVACKTPAKGSMPKNEVAFDEAK